MSHRTTGEERQQRLVQEMTQRMMSLVEQLTGWLEQETPTFAALEQQVLRAGKDLLASLLAQLVPLMLPRYDSPEQPCACGSRARYQRDRPAEVITLLGAITLSRPYYYCADCRHGFAPLDLDLQICANSVSAGLEELLALLGAQADSFEAAVPILKKLTLLEVAPNTVRAATERLGELVAASDAQLVESALALVPPAPLPGATPSRGEGAATYVSMDGTSVHLADGWHELKLGALYTTITRPNRKQPEQCELHAHNLSFVADRTTAEQFGCLLWAEALRRGVTATTPLVVIGDGAAWIWNIAANHFPGAVEIVDWYHASQYLWRAAHALFGEGTPKATAWADKQLTALWEGKVHTVLETLAAHCQEYAAVQEAWTYYTNNHQRMDYARYRAQGLQVGSGSIESGCKHVLAARLKQAGMHWSDAGARAVAKVRARLKSGRWDETIAERPPLRRGYVRQTLAA